MLRRVSLMTSRANELANPIGQTANQNHPSKQSCASCCCNRRERPADPQNPHAGKIPEIQFEYFIFLQNSVRIFFIAVAGIYSVAREPALTPRHEPEPDDPEPVLRGRPPALFSRLSKNISPGD